MNTSTPTAHDLSPLDGILPQTEVSQTPGTPGAPATPATPATPALGRSQTLRGDMHGTRSATAPAPKPAMPPITRSS